MSFDDGTVYVERPGSRWGRVNVSPDPFIDNRTLEVAYIPIADAPISTDNKGSTIKIEPSMFDYLDKANNHTAAASKWMRTPWMLWINRPYVGDPLGSTLASGADPQPVTECITASGNILRVLSETESHYEIYAFPMSESLSKYDPLVFNFKNFPWIFFKATARTRQGVLQKVGLGLDVYHMNIRKAGNRHYIHKSRLSLFTVPPFTVHKDGFVYTVLDYQFVGADIYGITQTGRVPLLVNKVYATEWRGPGQVVP
jgi:hypothetical protein